MEEPVEGLIAMIRSNAPDEVVRRTLLETVIESEQDIKDIHEALTAFRPQIVERLVQFVRRT